MPVNSVDPLDLDGWDHHSVWGYDEGTELWFAQLWRNTDEPSNPPTFWLGFRPPAEWACQIFDAIIAVTGAAPYEVRKAMGDDPYLDLRPGHLPTPPWIQQLLDTMEGGLPSQWHSRSSQ